MTQGSSTRPETRRWKFEGIKALCGTAEPGDGTGARHGGTQPSPISSSLDSRRAQNKPGAPMILYNSLSKIPPLESLLSSSDRALKLCHSSFRVHSEGKAEKLLFPKGKCKCTNSPFIWTAITFAVSHKCANWVKCWILILELPFHFPFQKISNTLFFP